MTISSLYLILLIVLFYWKFYFINLVFFIDIHSVFESILEIVVSSVYAWKHTCFIFCYAVIGSGGGLNQSSQELL